MALLQSFPPSNTISPSVRFTEQDLTLLTTTPATNAIGLVGFASKGPINTPTLVTSTYELHTLFGYPHPSQGYAPYLMYAAQNALAFTNAVWIVRVADTDPNSLYYATTASKQVPAAGGLLKVHGALFDVGDTISYPGVADYTYSFRWALNGVLSSKVVKLRTDAGRPAPFTGVPYTVPEIVDELNLSLNPTIDGVEFFLYTDSSTGQEAVGFQTVWAYGDQSSLELISVLDNLVGSTPATTGTAPNYTNVNNAIGLGNDMTVPVKTGTATHYPASASVVTPGIWDFPVGTYNLQVVTDGSGLVSVDNVIRTYDFSTLLSGASYPTTALLVADLNTAITTIDPTVAGVPLEGVPVCFQFAASSDAVQVTTNTALTDGQGLLCGRNAKINVRGGTLAAIFGFNAAGVTGLTPDGVADNEDSDANDGMWIGTNSIPVTDPTYYTFELFADSPGIEGNQTFVTFKKYPEGNTFSMDVFLLNPVTNATLQVEGWGNLSKDPDSAFYIQTYINSFSNYIRVLDNTATTAPPADTSNQQSVAQNDIRLSGGSDGYPVGETALRDALLIGSPVNMSGVYAFSDPEQINIDLCAVPGGTTTIVIDGLISMCEEYRQDCLAVIDPPAGLTPTEVVQWQNGQSPVNSQRFNSDFAALYWPWIMIYDSYNNFNVWCPPSVGTVAAIVNSDNISAPWFAPAGIQRGVVPNVIDVAYVPTLKEKDNMYGNQNAVNPIVRYAGSPDYVIWGQKTLQRAPTALDRINVRRMMFYVEKQIRSLSRQLLFQPHTDSLRRQFILLANGVLNNVQNNQGITAYKVVCDENLNPPEVIDRNELRAQIGIVPTRAVEFIFIEFTLYRTGALDTVTA
jgi:hypothetical protein